MALSPNQRIVRLTKSTPKEPCLYFLGRTGLKTIGRRKLNNIVTQKITEVSEYAGSKLK